MPVDVKGIFLAAAALDPADRPGYLNETCSGDVELRKRLEALLQAHDASIDNPATGAYSSVLGMSSDETPGTVIGAKYKLVEHIGEGGMGSVWMAQQTEPVKRFVAVKLIKAGMDSNQVLIRFEAERQALALMDHPNIAKILDGGMTEKGSPYFVMELVKGAPITRYCDEHKLTPRQRLELFVPVCQAIQHAHQKGIIHRDIKPSNVMVALYDDRPIPKVIDFGVAKATGQSLTDQTLHTGFGGIVGTPEYMSPEQATLNNLDIDTRSDIYSLGVLLYELLAGSPPFKRKELEQAGLLEILRVIREDEPPKPSTKLSTADALPSLSANRSTEPKKLTGILRSELDWIVMKALEKDRTRRYETANNFAVDVQRYLAGEPVNAAPPSAVYRAKKFVRRNKGAVTAVSLVLLTLLVGIAGTSWGLIRADQARQRESDRADGERAAKEEAARQRDETEAIFTFVTKRVFAAARPENKDGGLGHDVTLARALQASLPYVTEGFRDQPLTEARLRMTLGNSFRLLGKPEVAEQEYLRARELYFAKLGPDHPETLESMGGLALSYRDLGRHAEALVLQEEALKLRMAKLGSDHPDTLRIMHNLAISYGDAGRLAQALALREQIFQLRKTKLGPDHPDTLSSMTSLANSYSFLGRHAEALALNEETLKLKKAKLGPDHPDTLMTMNSLASNYHALGRHTEALALNEEALKLRKAKLGPIHPDTLGSMRSLAISYEKLGRHAEALALFEETLKLKKAQLGPDHFQTLRSMNDLATCYGNLGRYAESLALKEETLKLRKAKLGADHPDTLNSHWGAIGALIKLKRHEEALRRIDEVLMVADQAVATGKLPDLKLVPQMYDFRFEILKEKKDAAGCRSTAEKWENLRRTDANSFYSAACYRAACAAVMRENKEEGGDEQANKAMAWLTQAIAAGYKDIEHMKKDTDLEPLRERADFKVLMEQVEKAGAKRSVENKMRADSYK